MTMSASLVRLSQGIERSNAYDSEVHGICCDHCGQAHEAELARRAMARHAAALGWRVRRGDHWVLCPRCVGTADDDLPMSYAP